MLGKTHFAIGVATTLPIFFTGDISLFNCTVGIIGANAPDVDQSIGLKHRGFSHSLMATGLISYGLAFLSKEFALVFGLNYFVHILADSFTKKGVPFLYPAKHRFGLKLFKVNEKSDSIVYFLAIIVIIVEVFALSPLKDILMF